MVQRGIGAAFRALFGAHGETHPAPAPRAAPPDSLSSHSRYDTDGSSYEFEEMQVDQPPPVITAPDAPSTQARADPQDPNAQAPKPAPAAPSAPSAPHPDTGIDEKGPARVPLALRRLRDNPAAPAPAPSPDGQAGAGAKTDNDTPSSHYSLRPRRRRKPGPSSSAAAADPDPPGAETSRARDATVPSSVAAAAPHKISVRPSRAALLSAAAGAGEAAVPSVAVPTPVARGPLLPAPSAGTTSGIAGRPDLVALGELDTASDAALRTICRNIGISDAGSKLELRDRARTKLAERSFLKEDTQLVDADGNPRTPQHPPAFVAFAQPSNVKKSGGGNQEKGAELNTAERSRKRAFDQTTTTANRPAHHGPGPQPNVAPAVNKTTGDALGEGSQMAIGRACGMGPDGKPSEDVAVDTVGKRARPTLEIPVKGTHLGLTGTSNGFRTNSSTGIGAPRNMPMSPAFGVGPNAAGQVFAWVRPTQAEKVPDTAGNPTESVDARGGGQQKVDSQSIFRELASGKRDLSVNEYEACLKALQDNMWSADNKGGSDAAALLASKKVPGITAKMPPNSASMSQMGDPPNHPWSRPLTPSGLASNTLAGGAVTAYGMRPPHIPPAPPNTPGLASSSALPVNCPSLTCPDRTRMPFSPTVRGAAAVLRASSAKSGPGPAAGMPDRPDPLGRHDRNAGERERCGSKTDPAAPASTPELTSQQQRLETTRTECEMIPRESEMQAVENDMASQRNLHISNAPSVPETDSVPKAPSFTNPNHVQEAGTGRRGEFVFDLSKVEKPTKKTMPQQRPLRGIFAGAVGGPDVHNTVGSNGLPETKDGLRDGVKDAPVEARPDVDMPSSKNQASAADMEMRPSAGPRSGDFVTPREILRAYNRHSGQQASDEAAGSGSKDMPARQFDTDMAHASRRSRPDSVSTPVSLPRHLQGFSAMGTLGGTPVRAGDSGELTDPPGRVVGPSSFRPRRPISSTSGSVLVDLRKNAVARSNSYYAERMRRRGSVNADSSSQLPLSRTALRILEELKRIQAENRFMVSKKRNSSPMPVPPSVAKRARLEGSFAGRADRPRESVGRNNGVTGRDATSGGFTNVTNGIAYGVAEPSNNRTIFTRPISRLKSTPTQRRIPIAFGIGKKRSKPTPLSNAAVAEVKLHMDTQKSTGMMPSVASNETLPKSTLGDEANLAMERDSDANGLGNEGSRGAPFPGARLDAGSLPVTNNDVFKDGNPHDVLPAKAADVADAKAFAFPIALNTSKSLFASPLSTSAEMQNTQLSKTEHGDAGSTQPMTASDLNSTKHTIFAHASGQVRNSTPGLLFGVPKSSPRKSEHSPSFREPKPPILEGPKMANVSPVVPSKTFGNSESERLQEAPKESSVPSPFGQTEAKNVAGSLLGLAASTVQEKPSEPYSKIVSATGRPESAGDRAVTGNVDGKSSPFSHEASSPLKLATPAKAPTFSFGNRSPGQSPKFAFGNASGSNAEVLEEVKGSTEVVEQSPASGLPESAVNSGRKSSTSGAIASSGALFGTKIPNQLPAADEEKGKALAEPGEGADKQGPSEVKAFVFGSVPAMASASSSAFALPPDSGLAQVKSSSGDGRGVDAKPHGRLDEPADQGFGSNFSNPATVTPANTGSSLLSKEKSVGSSFPASLGKPTGKSGENPDEAANAKSDKVEVTGHARPPVAIAPSLFAAPTTSLEKPEAKTGAFGPTSSASNAFPGSASSAGALFGAPLGTSAAPAGANFTFGSNTEAEKPFAAKPVCIANPLNTATLFGVDNIGAKPKVEKSADTMTASATPPAGRLPTFAVQTAAESFPNPSSSSAPIFGQPASSPAFGSFGGTFGNTASGTQSQGRFSFGTPARQVEKDPNGPFGAPQFASPFPSAPNASTFVFGAASPPHGGTVNPTTSAGGIVAPVTGHKALTTPFGSGFQKSAIPFGSSQPAFPAPSQFGSSQGTPAAVGGPFGAPAATLGAGNPFGSSQAVLAGGTTLFGSSQPALAGAQIALPGFGATAGPTATPSFGGFGSGQPPTALGGPFGSGNPLPNPATSQPQFGAPFGGNPAAPQASFGGSNPTNGAQAGEGAFSMGTMGSNPPMARRGRRLKGRRTLR